ncbi:MAG TPA: hypothetical protein VH592_08945 [Gemmataceae bacterium]
MVSLQYGRRVCFLSEPDRLAATCGAHASVATCCGQGLDALGNAFAVHQEGQLHPPSQGSAEFTQAWQITSQTEGDPHELLRRISDQLVKAKVGELG